MEVNGRERSEGRRCDGITSLKTCEKIKHKGRRDGWKELREERKEAGKEEGRPGTRQATHDWLTDSR